MGKTRRFDPYDDFDNFSKSRKKSKKMTKAERDRKVVNQQKDNFDKIDDEADSFIQRKR